jgi:hypothetical protein
VHGGETRRSSPLGFSAGAGTIGAIRLRDQTELIAAPDELELAQLPAGVPSTTDRSPALAGAPRSVRLKGRTAHIEQLGHSVPFDMNCIMKKTVLAGALLVASLAAGCGSQTSQSYYYCWNSGPPSPHHLGHYVSGDHVCTDKEIGR